MEAVEEAMGSNSSDYSSSLARARRTKQQRRKRNHFAAAVADSSSASSAVLSETITEEDEDIAICLMLLAHGRTASTPMPEASPEEPAAAAADADIRSNIIIPQAAAATAIGVYECKTCNKCFPSFQALGGHRASHKKPKLEKKPVFTLQTTMDSISTSFARAAQNNKYYVKAHKIHECSLCGSEFSSGQALGGHMRRHRPAVNIPDLNLPAPLPAANDEPFTFPGERRLLFQASASALVGCHY